MSPPEGYQEARTSAPGRVASPAGPTAPARASIGGWYLVGLLTVAAVGIILLGLRSNVYDLDRYLVPKSVALHATALLALPVLLFRWRRVRLALVDALLVVFVAWSTASALLAHNHWLAMAGLGISFSSATVYVAARSLAPNQRATLVAALAFAAALGSGLGVAQAYGADWSFLGTTRPPGGTFGNRNFLAHLTAIATPLLLLVRVRARNRLPAFLAAVGLLLAAVAIVLTRSRAAWLGLAAGLLALAVGTVVGWKSIRSSVERPRHRVRGAILALALGAAAAVTVPNRLDWRSANPYAETLTRITDYQRGSGRGRLVQYRNSLKMLRFDPVFGVGPGNWFVHYPRVTTPGDAAFDRGDPSGIPTNPWPSSDWVTFFVERGPIGALLLLGALLAATLASLRAARSGDRDRALGAVALLGVLGAAFVCGLFNAVLLLPTPAFFVFAATGALLTGAPRPVVDRPITGGRRLAASAAMVILALAATALTAGQLYALVVTQNSTSRRTVDQALTYDPGDYRLDLLMLARGSCASRIRYARAAADLLPYHAAPRRTLRECGARP